LGGIPDQDELAVLLLGEFEQLGEAAGADDRCLIDEQHPAGGQVLLGPLQQPG